MPRPGAGDAAVRVVLDLVLARAEQDEVAAQQPGQEVDRLADLVGVVARARLAREPDHRLARAAVIAPKSVTVLRTASSTALMSRRQLLELAVGQLAREVVVHDRLAVDRVAGVRDARDPPVLARDPDDRVHEPRDVLAARARARRSRESTRNGQSSVLVSSTEPSGS